MMNRRRFLQQSGLILWLPVLESMVPEKVFAQTLTRNKFVGILTPSGFYMPPDTGGSFTSNGNWTFTDALQPVVDAGFQNNTMILRGVLGAASADPHWLNTASFLSCEPILLRADRPTVAGKTFDQILIQQPQFQSLPLKSISVGWRPMNRDFSADHSVYSDRYLDTLSWREANRPVANIYSPQQLFDTIFTTSAQGKKHLQALNSRRKSILDVLLTQVQDLQRKVSSEDKQRLDLFAAGVRDVENTFALSVPADCQAPVARPDLNPAYSAHFQLMHAIIAQAFACNLIASATIMYDDGVGDVTLLYPGANSDHHRYAHHDNFPDLIAILRSINKVHGGLYAHFLGEMKKRSQLDTALVLWGSNMSNGNIHAVDNLPMVISGGGTDLKFGQEVGNPTTRIRKADIFVELAGLYGINMTSFGSADQASQGQKIGLKK